MIAAVSSTSGTSLTAAPSKGGHGMSFGEIMSCLNPLQYVPVVGTIYRAVTGDTIPAPVREVGSLVFSGLTSGPIGIGISLGVGAIERAVGFDEEKFGQGVLAALGVGHAAAAPVSSPTGLNDTALASAGGTAFSSSDLAQFGLAQSKDGSISGGGLTGADALNAMELRRLATTAYAKAGTLAAA